MERERKSGIGGKGACRNVQESRFPNVCNLWSCLNYLPIQVASTATQLSLHTQYSYQVGLTQGFAKLKNLSIHQIFN